MKITRKLLICLTVFIFCFSILNAVWGNERIVANAIKNTGTNDGSIKFSSVSGTVTLIRDSIIRLVDKNNSEFDFLLTEKTALTDTTGIISADSIKEGDSVTAYYIAPEVTIMIYPPQYETSVLVKKTENDINDVFVGFFDSSLTSSDGGLKLNVTGETPILNLKGETYKGSIENKALIVYYSFETLSIPPQTSPAKIVALDFIPNKKLDLTKLSETPLYVNGKLISGASSYLNNDGVIMVPLRLLSDVFGFTLKWDSTLKQVMVGTATILTIGLNEYTIREAETLNLDAAPEIKDNYTYVPVSFMTDIMNIGYDTAGGVLSFRILNE